MNLSLQATALETRARLEETERTKQLLEDRITTVDRELLMERSIAAQKEAEVRAELQRLCLENQSLHHQLSSTSETRRDDDIKREQLLRDKEKAVEDQRQQLTDAQTELERLRAENASLVQQLTAASKGKDEELEEQRRKNNELRDKNYKAMDALAAAEKALQETKKSAAKQQSDPSQVHRSISASLRRVFPDLSLDDAVASSSSDFAESLASRLADSVRRIETDEQSKAVAQVSHYKTVLSQTEELLHRLQSRVEAEQTTWKAQLAEMDVAIATVRQEKDFWMEQCQNKDQQQTEVDASLQNRIESLTQEKERILQVNIP